MKINSASQQKLAHARPQSSPQKQGQSPIKKNKYLVSSGISTITKTDNKVSKSTALSHDLISLIKNGANSQNTNQLLDKKQSSRSKLILDINDANLKKNRPNSRLLIQNIVKNKKTDCNLKYHESLIQKQFQKLLGLQKQHNQTHISPPQIHNRAMSNGDLKPTSDIANKLIEYIKKQSAKQLKGYRSISNPDIILTDRRLIQKYAVKTQAGLLHTKKEKVNQDSYAIHERIGDIDNSYLLQVSDGHGIKGHEVAQFVQERLPTILDQLLKLHKMGKKDQDMIIQMILKQAFERTTKELYQSGIDITYSGATTVCLLIIEHTGWCANIGDSRAIIGRQKEGLHVVELSHDQKPDLPKEEKRIISNGGRVQAYSDEEGNPIGPARVWLKDENVPGLAMSRSFGDYVAAQVGVISIPEIIKHTFQNDKFLIIASDGIWEFLDNQWVIDIVYSYYLKNDAEGAVERLVIEATEAWKKEDEVIDDITCIVAFLN
ncbi:unnamed protein product (macronuclear) [Paramecium tetraurelia]|uniref:PPM-type phosphatase domain-containing protein n=1 Tax=Paramecium tetraurelia TaxID=5888 RepID=A0D6B7_PARTE|nr:uncharacterized protein GSPATT00001625001 [Paramecium tetraurelia]CAK78584.1 unnamed protein product [Paramecium tetraurelia]|eukprot:XP_001445981.1 hypothetical protein (macronuclear) [Paramecium tetraurelia strain d4-2]